VQAVAQRLGITHVYAARSPEQKAAVVEELGATHVLFVGDGVNDAAAFAAAACAGTPALERPQLPARADFYTLAQGLGPLCRTVDVAAAWRRATRTAMVTAVAYNVVAVGLALGGVLTPLFCAVLMPASSVVVVALVRAAFGRAVSLDAASLAPTLSKRSA
jgi:Cu2+-exporting ATPase